MADPPPYHCKDCGLVFDSGKSLDVHLHYHKENLLSKWAQQPNDESNNNHVHHKKSNGGGGGGRQVAAAPADSSEPPLPQQHLLSPVDRYFQHHGYLSPPAAQPEEAFVLGAGSGFPQMARTPTPNSSSSPSPHQQAPPPNNYRYHPYHHQQQYAVPPPAADHRNGLVSSSSPQQCDKCGFVCESASMLVEHVSAAHPPTPEHLYRQQQPGHQQHPQIKSEPGVSQAEILDLDSHKVHVYQPPPPTQELPPQEHSVSALMSWVNSAPHEKEQRRFHPQNGGSGLASPDCYGGVSTTTLSPPDPADHQMAHQQQQQQNTYHHQQQQQQFEHISRLGPNSQQHITSTQLPLVVNQTGPPAGGGGGKMKGSGSGSGSSGGGSWKSNEARRPKTYNCSACNKWFTSSGHLKRHYNTTLHKNAVKTSGVPDPAIMPISAHHHPQKDPTYGAGGGPNSPLPPDTSPMEEPPPPLPPQQQQQQQQPLQQLQQQPQPPAPHHLNHLNHHLNHFLPSPPNLMAGPSEVTGGLLLHTTPYQEIMQTTSPTPTTTPSGSFQPFTHHHQPHTPTYQIQQHPNFQPPHVSTTGPLVTTTSSIFGNLNLIDIQQYLLEAGKRELQQQQEQINIPLPSFAQFQQNLVPNFSFHQVVSSSDSDVGGPQQLSSNFETLYRPASPLDEDSYYDSLQMDDDKSQIVLMERPPSSCGHTSTDSAESLRIVQGYGGEDASVSSTIRSNSPPETALLRPPERTEAAAGAQPKTPIHRCDGCDKVFNKACYLTQHNKSFHSGVKPFKCERCGKRFPDECQHQEHISKHAGEKPYKCEICPKQFNHKTDMRRHMFLHTGDKPYACDTCGKGFIRKDHMLKHCETHTRRKTTHAEGPRAPGGGKQGAALTARLKMQQQQAADAAAASSVHMPPPLPLQMVM